MTQTPEYKHSVPNLKRWQFFRGLIGAVIGGIVGYFAVVVIFRYFSILALPMVGLGIGLGRAALFQRNMAILSVICGVLALFLTPYVLYKLSVRTGSFFNYMGDLFDQPMLYKLGIAASVIIAAWFGWGRRSRYISR